MAWYNASWLKRKKVTVNNSFIDSPLTNFPLWYHIDGDSDISTNSKNSYGDVRVTTSDGTTECPVYVTPAGVLYWEAPSLSSTVGTDFYIYYDNSAATAYSASDTYGQYNVVNATYDYWATLHEPITSSSQTHFNEASTNYSGTVRNMSGDEATGGPTKAYWDFSNNAVGFPSPAAWLEVDSTSFHPLSPTITTLTISGWMQIYPSQASSYNSIQALCGDYNSSGANKNIIVGGYSGNASLGNIRIYDTNGNASIVNNLFGTTNLAGYSDGTWIHFGFTYTGTTYNFYLNGVADGSGSDTYNNASTNARFMVGSCYRSSFFNDFQALGGITDLRISRSTAVSADWIKAEYSNSQEPTFWTIGTEETNGPAPSTPYRTQSTIIN
jgi:hypothetical protein